MSPDTAIQIRTYQPGDEIGQVAIYNEATRGLPGFKPATVDDVLRRNRSANFDPATKFYAMQGDRMVGYASYSQNGRVSAPWTVPDAASAAEPLMHAMTDLARQRGIHKVWAAYRADWSEVLAQLESFGFRRERTIDNFLAGLDALPRDRPQQPLAMAPVERDDLAAVYELDTAAFDAPSQVELAGAWFDGPYLAKDAFYCLRDAAGGIVGAALAVVNPQYADPAKIDSAMPCFRLGAIGTELERTKRVNGLFSYVTRSDADSEQIGRVLLSEACRRFSEAGLANVAAQCPSDRPREQAFYRRYFQPQKSFPVYVKSLD